jgi:hypothetical protein
VSGHSVSIAITGAGGAGLYAGQPGRQCIRPALLQSLADDLADGIQRQAEQRGDNAKANHVHAPAREAFHRFL